MSTQSPTQAQRDQAKVPHDIFLANLIGNHILLATAISTMGGSYIQWIVLVPLISFVCLGIIFYRAAHFQRASNEFAYIHWQVARRWSVVLSIMLLVMLTVSGLGWLGYSQLGMMREAVLAIVGGLAILPTLITVFVLVVLESDALHQARAGSLPVWAQKRFLQEP